MGGPDSRDPRTIPATCHVHGGAAGFCNLRVLKADGGIVLDPHVTGACVIVLDEAGATQLFDLLGGVAGVMTERAPITGIVDSDDPWIRGVLKLRAAVLSGDVETPEEITAYASELSRGLPTGGPPPSIAAFIAADIKVTFPVMANLLWTPS